MRLLKSIYGLKQASREWYKLFHQTLSSLGLKRATFDTFYLHDEPPNAWDMQCVGICGRHSHRLGLTKVD
jgi:hypothetical protein